jgi:hypothetical protein
MYKTAVPVVAILHGTHEISLHTVLAMFGRIKAFQSMWTPIYYGPGTVYKAFEDHVAYKTFLDSSSTLLADPITQIRVDYKGDSGIKEATSNKLKEQTRMWSFDGLINCVPEPNIVNEHGMFHDYIRQRIL